MFNAIDEKGNRINALEAVKGNNYYCPCCKENLILKQGKLIDWHFSHRGNTECTEAGEMCEWHLRMQSYFSPQYREIVIEDNGIKHRADILKDGYVIEFQHSPISYDDFNNRNKFYRGLGYKVIWIFDSSDWFETERFTDLLSDDRIYEKYDEEDVYDIVRFKRPFKVLQESYIDFDNISICFCEYDDYEEKDYVFNVYWHSKDWSTLGMFRGNFELSDEADLGELFKDRSDFKRYYLKNKSTKKVYIGIRGHRYKEYLCKQTNTWAENCEKCLCCELIEQRRDGRVVHCNIDKKYKIQNNKVTKIFYRV